jgi:preprotein translocase subunit SecA
MKKNLERIRWEADRLKFLTDAELSCLVQSFHEVSWKASESEREKWFALVQEISWRKLGLRHYSTQLLAGLLLDEGKIIEMKTGEGKTLASSLAISFKSLQKKGAHVVTVNDYLAERDAKWMGKLYSSLGLTTGLVVSGQSIREKQKNYGKDITYVTNSTVVFDYLRDNLALSSKKVSQRGLYYCLIDEIDSVLIDEARVPLIISSSQECSSLSSGQTVRAKSLIEKLEEGKDFVLDRKKKEVSLTEAGYENLAKKGKNLVDFSSLPQNLLLAVLNALRVKFFYLRDRDYILSNNRILLIDEFTGRFLADRRWSFGIQEAIECKEGIFSSLRSSTQSSITYQSFFPLYRKIAGMTGTALSSAKEFESTYGLSVQPIPTYKKLLRKDLSDQVYLSLKGKWKALINQAQTSFAKGQPLLIGTLSIETSELLSELFRLSQLPHTVLNGRPEFAGLENKIVAQAGQLSSLTIATNMAGRGTDIKLGGDFDLQLKEDVLIVIRKLVQELAQRKKSRISRATRKGKLAKAPFSLPQDENQEKVRSKKLDESSSRDLQKSIFWDGFQLIFRELKNFLFREFQFHNWDKFPQGLQKKPSKAKLTKVKLSALSKLKKKPERKVLKSLSWKKVVYYLLKFSLSAYRKEFLSFVRDFESLPYSLKESKIPLKLFYYFLKIRYEKRWQEENEKVKRVGGLFVLGTERSENLRIDDQLRGRSGRQGDPGRSQFFVSLDDDLIKRFASPNLASFLAFFGGEEDSPLESSFLDKSLRNIQKKIENANYDTRKNLLEYNELEDFQRKCLFTVRADLLRNASDYFLSLTFKKKLRVKIFSPRLYHNLKSFFPSHVFFSPLLASAFAESSFFSTYASYFPSYGKDKLLWLNHDLQFATFQTYKLRKLKKIFFPFLDTLWTEHLRKTSFFRETIGWKAYGQQKPLQEFNLQSFFMYKKVPYYFGLSLIYQSHFPISPFLLPED